MISMKDIAREAGVSRTTISFVLNGRYKNDLKISRPIVERVLETADRLGYVQNELVHSVVTGKSRVIAIISQLEDYMMPAIRGCVDEASQHGCIIKLIPREEDINRSIINAVKFRVAGIFAIALPTTVMEQVDPKFFGLGIPSIGLMPHSGRMSFDQETSSMRGTEYLIAQGQRRIFFAGADNEIAQERERGYRRVMKKYQLPEHILRVKVWDQAGIDQCCRQILAEKMDAVQCYCDPLALRLLQLCYKQRIFLPEAFSVIGFGNITASLYSSPPLTTIDEPYYETGRIMFKQIYDLISGANNKKYEKLIGKVIIRESAMPRQGSPRIGMEAGSQ